MEKVEYEVVFRLKVKAASKPGAIYVARNLIADGRGDPEEVRLMEDGKERNDPLSEGKIRKGGVNSAPPSSTRPESPKPQRPNSGSGGGQNNSGGKGQD